MTHTAINGMRARRMAAYGRTAGVVMLVCAASLWALEIPGMHNLPEKPEPKPAEPGLGTPAPTEQQATPKVDAEGVIGMSERLNLAVVHAPKQPVTPKGEEIVTPPEPEGPQWEYLGPIFAGERSLAIVSVDGTQKILAEGRLFGSTKLMKVSHDEIEVEAGKATKTIKRKEKDPSQSVAWMRNMQNNAPMPGTGMPVAAGQPVAGRGNLPPEVQARLAERGITPEQMAQWRQNRDGRGGQGRNGNGNNNGGGGNAITNGTTSARQRAVPDAATDRSNSGSDADAAIRSRRRN